MDEITEGVTSLLDTSTGAQISHKKTPAEQSQSEFSFSIGSVVVAGLVEGINPCAFSTILFLLSMLSLAGRTKKQLLYIGIVFTMTVFLAYYAAGLGLLVSVRALLSFPLIAAILRWFLVVLLFALALLSIRDGVLAAQGRTNSMTLQLSVRSKNHTNAV